MGIFRDTSRNTPMQTDLDSYVYIPMCLPHAYSPPQISDVARGLCYLHSCNVIHGNLKGVRSDYKSRLTTALTFGQPNVLVDAADKARITDFCLAAVTTDVESQLSTSLIQNHTLRWTAPEILNGGKHSREADIFSFAMVVIEVRHG